MEDCERRMKYAIVVHKDPGSTYGVTVPGLPGCFSGGETLDEAFANAREAIACHIEGYLLEGEPVPEERPLEEHQANADYADGMWGFVDVDLSGLSEMSLGEAVRLDVTLPQYIVNAVDNAAARSGETRSGFLAHAALAEVARRLA